MRTRRRHPGQRLLDFAGGLLSALLVSSAMAVQIVGPLLSQNLLSEIAAQGSTAQATARTNLGISGTPPFMPIAGGTFTGPVIWNSSATATFMASLTGSPASANVTFSPTGTGQVIIAPATAGTIDNMVLGGVTPLAGHVTTLSASGAVSGTGFTNLFASPPAIGGTAAAAGKFTTLQSTGLLTTVASATGGAGINLPPGVAPTSPNNGDVWVTSTGLFVRVAGATVGPLVAAGTDPLTSAHIFVGNGSNIATDVAMSGDVSITNTGATTVGKINGTAIALGATGTFWPGHSLIGMQTFCASGCSSTGGTYTADAGTNQVIFEVQAAGGGSGGCAATGATTNCVSQSASAGTYCKVLYTTGFNSIPITIGAVGTAGAAGNNAGGNGTTTTVGSAGALISAPGGLGNPGGAAFTATIPNTFAGASPPSACTITGGTTLVNVRGGASAGSVSLGALGTYLGGNGGNSVLGSGGPGSGETTAGGNPGLAYGGGASGAVAQNAAAQAGATGGPGIVIVYEFN